MQINSSGNVGIGTTSPSNKLHVLTGTPTSVTTPLSTTAILIDSNGDQYLEFRTTGASSGYMQGIAFTDNGRNAFIGYKEYTGAVANTYGEALHLAYYDYSASDSNSGLYIGSSNTPASGVSTVHLFVKANGNVGIGTTSPGSKLDVNGLSLGDVLFVPCSGLPVVAQVNKNIPFGFNKSIPFLMVNSQNSSCSKHSDDTITSNCFSL